MKRLTMIAMMAMIALTFISCTAQVKMPETPAGRGAEAWLKAFDSGDRSAYIAYLEKNSPQRIKNIDREMQFRKDTGGFDVRKIKDASTPTKIVVLMQEHSSDQFAELTIEVAPDEPHTVTQMQIRGVDRPAEFALPRMTETGLLSAVKTKLQNDASSGTFSGDLLIAHSGKTILEQAYGLADREKNLPNTLNTRFRIGSMNKMFTAVCVMQLVQAGKVHLDDPLGKYLPEYPNKDVANKVTVRHLLTHTGGTGDFFGPEFDAHRLELKTLDDYVKLYGDRPLRFEPGTKWEYSNYGFLLLGLIVQRVSGESYYDYVRDHVYKIAGMTATGSDPEDSPVADRSVGYTTMGSKDGQLRPNTDTLPYRGTSAGGGYSTVEDLLRFANALQDHKLLNGEYTDMLTTGKPETPNNSYAFGFEDRKVGGVRCFGHGGGAPGMNGMLEICPATGYVVAALANLDPPAASRIADFVTNRMQGSAPGK